MAAKKKDKPESPGPGASPSTRSMRDAAEKKLKRSRAEITKIKGQTPEQLLHELQVHQIELETQAEELRRAQLELGESRDQYLDLYEFAPNGYLTLTDTALISKANLTAAVLIGVERSRLIGGRFRKWISAEDSDAWDRYFTSILQDEKKLTATLIIKRGDGHAFPARLEGIRLTDPRDGTRTVRVAVSDISDIRQVEEALRESEKKLRTIIDILPVGISVLDAGRKIVYENPALRTIVQMTPEGLRQEGYMTRRYIRPDGTPMPEKEFASIRAGRDQKAIHNVETGIVLKDGRVIWTDVSAVPIALPDWKVVVITSDITERKRAEEALRQSEEFNKSIIENSLDCIKILDIAGNLQFMSDSGQKLLEICAINQYIGRSWIDFWTGKDHAAAEKAVAQAAQGGTGKFTGYSPTEKGTPKWWDVVITPIKDESGHVVRLLSISRDITEGRYSEEALRKSEQKLREADDLLEAVTKGTDVIIAAEDTEFRYTYFNKAYAEEIRRLTGKELSLGMSMVDLFAHQPEQQKNAVRAWSRVLGGESVNQTIGFGDPAAGRKIYNVLHTPIKDSTGSIIGAGEVAYDITRQVGIEEALRETTQYLENLMNYANAPIIVWDPEFRITLFNHAFEHLTGWDAAEVIGRHLEILIPEKYLKDAMDLIRKTAAGERWESVEIPIKRKDGGIRTVLWNSGSVYKPDGKTIESTIAQGQDITARKKIESENRKKAAELSKMNVALINEISQRREAEKTAKQALSQLSAAIESTADGIYVTDTAGTITGYNHNFVSMWNIPKETLDSLDDRNLSEQIKMQVKNAEMFQSGIEELRRHPERESYDMLELNDGRIFERISKPQKMDSSVVGRVWSFRDVTDRRRAEEAVLASLQEKETLIREIHHRVKNNLQIITGLLDMTRIRMEDPATAGILTDLMMKIKTMAQIHTRLYESRQFDKIDMGGQIRDQIMDLSSIYGRSGTEIKTAIEIPEINLPVDQAVPFALIVNEILSNVFKHAFKGRRKGLLKVSAEQHDSRIRIIVRDDGTGIPGDVDIHQTNSLGLKLVRNLVQQLKGSFTVQSSNGTEVIVEFPLR